MKTIYKVAIASAIALSLTGCAESSAPTPGKAAKLDLTPATAAKLDQKEVCNVDKLGIAKVIANAKMYNDVAIKEGVEYRRLNVNNRDLIKAVEEGIAKGAKEVNPVHFKSKPKKVKKSKTKLEINYAAHRACAFGLSALQNKHEGKSTWRKAVPGDGYKF